MRLRPPEENMSANPKFLAATAAVDEAAIQPLPNSRKIYVEGSRPDIACRCARSRRADTPASFGAEKNPPIIVYDTSGPYTDPDAKIDIRSGLAALRDAVDRRARRHRRARPARPPHTAVERLNDPEARGAALQPASQAAPREGRHERVADALRAPRHRHAGDGVRRDPREPAPREYLKACTHPVRRQSLPI